MKDMLELESEIKSLEKKLHDKISKLKFNVYCQGQYDIYTLAAVGFDVESMEELGRITHTSNVFALNTREEYGYTSLTNLFSDSLVDAVMLAAKNGLQVYSINANYNATRVCTVIRKNAEKLLNHPEKDKLEQLLATCDENNLQLVIQLLKVV